MKGNITILLLFAVMMMCWVGAWADDVTCIDDKDIERTCTTAGVIAGSVNQVTWGTAGRETPLPSTVKPIKQVNLKQRVESMVPKGN